MASHNISISDANFANLLVNMLLFILVQELAMVFHVEEASKQDAGTTNERTLRVDSKVYIEYKVKSCNRALLITSQPGAL